MVMSYQHWVPQDAPFAGSSVQLPPPFVDFQIPRRSESDLFWMLAKIVSGDGRGQSNVDSGHLLCGKTHREGIPVQTSIACF